MNAPLKTYPTAPVGLTRAQLDTYATIIVAFSGGKDSVACVLHLLELGVPRERIELWHHDVDGREGSTLMDWPVTRAYCRAFADGEEAKVQLIPFVGIGPRRYVELFMLRDPFGNHLNRKAKEGRVVEWRRSDAWPLLPDLLINYLDMEDEALVKLKGILGGGRGEHHEQA